MVVRKKPQMIFQLHSKEEFESNDGLTRFVEYSNVTIVIEAPTVLNRTVCRAAERFYVESVGSFPVSTSV